MRFMVFGAGLMGSVAAYDLARGPDTDEVILADMDGEQAGKAAREAGGEGACPLRGIQLDVTDGAAVRQALEGVDAALSAVPYLFNLELAKACIDTGTHFCDMGGNNDVVDATLALDERARAAGVTLIPDCGVAPGQVSIYTAAHVEELDETEEVHLRVGGLPTEPTGELKYRQVFSINGLINEYVEPARILRDGQPAVAEPMGDLERLEFPAPFGELEAFNTSGGTSTLVETYKGKIKTLDYKTMRYPNHAVVFRSMLELGFFSQEPIEVKGVKIAPRDLAHELLAANLPAEGKDCILMRLESIGTKDGKRVRLRDQGVITENEAGHSAMAQCTAYSAALITRMTADGTIEPGGARPQETCVPTDAFLAGMKARGLGLERTVEEL